VHGQDGIIVAMDQRRHSRKPLAVPVGFATKEGPGGEGTSRDLSLGGMFVETDLPLPFGAAVTLHFTLPGGAEPLALAGVVRWTKPDGMGIQFGSLGARETHAITEATR